jgi:phage terminase small subunit
MPGTKNSGGRNAKPRAMHVVQGTFREDRHGAIENPEPPIGRPEPPKPLSGDARAEWDRMIGRLDSSKTLSVVDDAALYQYAMLFGETEAVVRDQAENRRLSSVLVNGEAPRARRCDAIRDRCARREGRRRRSCASRARGT